MERLTSTDPQRIGAYNLISRLGAGGMGRVYLARSDRGRIVALKLVHHELAVREEFRIRFRQEVDAARRVGGQWTAPVLDADTEAAVPWVATGYMAGPSLREVVGQDHGPLGVRSVRILAAGLAHALTDIHAAGLIHRDLKPSNVLVTIDGPRVIDFGIARALEASEEPGLTRTGQLIGSPGFMAPEQVSGATVTPACDVFCLGTLLAYAATGSLPFGEAESIGGLPALLIRISQDEPDLDRVPEELRDLVRDCLHKDPARRPTPAQILARVGADHTVADGKARESWLPASLIEGIARASTSLLDHEDDRPRTTPPVGPGHTEVVPPHPHNTPPPPGIPGTGTPTGGTGRDAATLVGAHSHPGGPAAPPPPPYNLPPHGGTPPPGHGYGYGYPHPHTPPPYLPQPPQNGGGQVGIAKLIGVGLVVALLAGGAVFAIMQSQKGDPEAKGGTHTASGAPGTSTDPNGSGGNGGKSGDVPASTPNTTPTNPQAATPNDSVPSAYLGDWVGSLGGQTWRIRLAPGRVGDSVMDLSMTADGLSCGWTATLVRGGGSVEVSATNLTYSSGGGCSSGPASSLSLGSDGTLHRDTYSSAKSPKVYYRG
ncbi:serine/threonine-protein kinase [Streptomyces sp. BI20]|uniref:serine/threonine-protein kinase n=1 Tax=Streptomyces sp. BI20 TaxID=3403460 RepID=UPI003C70FF8A